MASRDYFEQANQRAKDLQARIPRALSARYDHKTGRIVIHLSSKLIVSFSPGDVEGLEDARPSQLGKVAAGSVHETTSPGSRNLGFKTWPDGLCEGPCKNSSWLVRWYRVFRKRAPSDSTSPDQSLRGRLVLLGHKRTI